MTEADGAMGASEIAEGADAQNLQGRIDLAPDWGAHTRWDISPGDGNIELVQGNPPLQQPQLSLSAMPRIPMPRPGPVIQLQAGPNMIPISQYWYSASLGWSYSGGAGAAKLSMAMPGLPIGMDGWSVTAEMQSSQQGTFQIVGTPQSTAWIVSFEIQGGQPIVRAYADGNYLGTFADGTEVAATGYALTLEIDSRGLPAGSQVAVGYTLMPGQSPSAARARPAPERPASR